MDLTIFHVELVWKDIITDILLFDQLVFKLKSVNMVKNKRYLNKEKK